MDEWSALGIPFLFIIDFEKQKPIIRKLSDLDRVNADIWYSFPNRNNDSFWTERKVEDKSFSLHRKPYSQSHYLRKFQQAQELFKRYGVQVINLTMPTPVSLETSLAAIYQVANAKYKIYYENHFVCCTPEIFVRINEQGTISSFPMKGTIDANLPQAEQLILNNPKELREHTATVNQLKLDLAEVATAISVPRFRYVDKLHTSDKDLLQVSSEVQGKLQERFKSAYGQLFNRLLPAGSIVGSPRLEALKVIDEVEGYTRGYYTGVCGVFDGKTLDSCVLIRIIEKEEGNYYYKSGGGITSESNAESEYEELIDKIYVPLD